MSHSQAKDSAQRVRITPLTREEFDATRDWLKSERSKLPKEIGELLERVLNLYLILSGVPDTAKRILARLREKMRITPTSERSSSILGKLLGR